MKYSNVVKGEEFVISITKEEVKHLRNFFREELTADRSPDTVEKWKIKLLVDLFVNPEWFINSNVIYSWKFKEVFDKYLKPSFTKGMVFDLHQDGESTIRVIALSEYVVMNLETGEALDNIESENEIGDILIYDIFTLNQQKI